MFLNLLVTLRTTSRGFKWLCSCLYCFHCFAGEQVSRIPPTVLQEHDLSPSFFTLAKLCRFLKAVLFSQYSPKVMCTMISLLQTSDQKFALNWLLPTVLPCSLTVSWLRSNQGLNIGHNPFPHDSLTYPGMELIPRCSWQIGFEFWLPCGWLLVVPLLPIKLGDKGGKHLTDLIADCCYPGIIIWNRFEIHTKIWPLLWGNRFTFRGVSETFKIPFFWQGNHLLCTKPCRTDSAFWEVLYETVMCFGLPFLSILWDFPHIVNIWPWRSHNAAFPLWVYTYHSGNYLSGGLTCLPLIQFPFSFIGIWAKLHLSKN